MSWTHPGRSASAGPVRLDMGADAAVYGVALYAVGRSRSLQAGAATTSGVLQIALGLGVLIEVARRSVYGSEPISLLIIVTLVMYIFGIIGVNLLKGHSNFCDTSNITGLGPK